MRRRGNKSAKVPNVKLRPAQEGTLKPLRPTQEAEASIFWAQDSQILNNDASVADLCPRPFKDLVVCATGVVDKPTLFKQALELGATCISAFTDRVTHLVAVDHGGAKYMCALERKIPILKSTWITDCYQIWLRGDDVDVNQSVETHRLPIFSNVVLCPSGITEITRRTEINKLVTAHEGLYLKNLERPVKVTHLLCSGDEETDKMRYAEKFNSRGEAKIHLVWEEWFWDSLEFGGRFDEEKYQVRRPRPERKSIVETPSSPPPSSAVGSEPGEPSSPLPNQIADPDDEEPAQTNRLPSLTLQLWGGLLQKRGYEVTDGGEILRSPSKSQANPRPKSPVTDESFGGGGSVISSFRRANSFAQGAVASTSRQPFQRTTTAGVLPSPEWPKSGESSTPPSTKLFHGIRFRALGEAKSASVKGAIEGCGGTMVADMDDDVGVDYIIVRLVSGSKLFRAEQDAFQRSKYRTECWLERCIFEDRMCPPSDHISFEPLGIDVPVPGAENINLSFSGFDQSEACWIKRLLRGLGINLAQFFSRNSTHLLCPSGTGAKFEKAREWGVPVVSMAWLEDMARKGVVPSADTFLVGGVGVVRFGQAAGLLGGGAHDKGKGKEVDNKPVPPGNNGRPLSQPLDRQDTIPFVESGSVFGPPNGILGPSQRGGTSLPKTDSFSALEYATPQNSLGGTGSNNFKQHSTLNSHPRTPSQKRPSLRDIERDRKRTRVPSSKSPSPMKLPAQKAPPQAGSGRLSASPTKDREKEREAFERMRALDGEKQKALQESITSLLGKRPPAAGEESGRAGKRARPHRSKPQSRQPSDTQVSDIGAVPILTEYGESMGLFEVYDELNLGGEVKEESMRVMYEDPGQRDEKKRLMNLLKSPNDDGDAAGKDARGRGAGLPRRSMRVAGF